MGVGFTPLSVSIQLSGVYLPHQRRQNDDAAHWRRRRRMDDLVQETVRHGPAVEMAKTEATGQQSEPARKSKRAAPLMRERRSWSWRSLLAGGIGLLLAFVLVLHFGRLLTLPSS